MLIADVKGKLEVFNKQYTSVFTDKDTSNIPELDPSPHPCLAKTSYKGVGKLLKNLFTSKASGPDNIHSNVLKELPLRAGTSTHSNIPADTSARHSPHVDCRISATHNNQTHL